MSMFRLPVSQPNCLITRQGARRADVGIRRVYVGMFSFLFFRLIGIIFFSLLAFFSKNSDKFPNESPRRAFQAYSFVQV